MISEKEVVRIGKLIKPHGVKGEIAFAFENDIFDKTDCPYLICCIDGILVPFFIEEYRFKNNETALVKFEDINSEEKARQLNDTEVFYPISYFDSSHNDTIDYSWKYFIGFSVKNNASDQIIGTISAVDDSTINALFLVTDDNENEFLIPANEDLITNIDNKSKVLEMNIPDGLLEVF
ncbi:MAG: ribosome maturation factor RimM [Dysgonomonas sp.]